VRTQIVPELDIARLIERTYQVARFQDSRQDLFWVSWVRTQISIPQVGRGYQSTPARQIQQDVAARQRATDGISKGKDGARGRRWLCKLVNRHLKCA
jgi:hypothetical protein